MIVILKKIIPGTDSHPVILTSLMFFNYLLLSLVAWAFCKAKSSLLRKFLTVFIN